MESISQPLTRPRSDTETGRHKRSRASKEGQANAGENRIDVYDTAHNRAPRGKAVSNIGTETEHNREGGGLEGKSEKEGVGESARNTRRFGKKKNLQEKTRRLHAHT